MITWFFWIVFILLHNRVFKLQVLLYTLLTLVTCYYYLAYPSYLALPVTGMGWVILSIHMYRKSAHSPKLHLYLNLLGLLSFIFLCYLLSVFNGSL